MRAGERVWVLDQHGRPMDTVTVEDRTAEGLVVIRFDGGLRFPIRADKLRRKPCVAGLACLVREDLGGSNEQTE